jgi:tetratricopeptide (TPR) repeat protein
MKSTRLITFWGLLLVLLLLPSGCGSRQAETVLDDVESYIQARPDSALTVLRALDTTTLNSQKLRAHYALLHAMALDKNWIDTTDAGVVMPAVKYYDRHRPIANRAKPYYYLGRIQFNGRHYAEAIVSFTRAREYAAGLDDDRFKALNEIALANTYNATSAYEEALSALEEAEPFGIRCQDTMVLYTIIFDKAQYLINLKRFHEADSLFKELVQEDNSFVRRFPGVLSSYALFLVTPPNQDYEKARALFEKVIHKSGTLGSEQYWSVYALCLANTGDVERAKKMLSQIENRKTARHTSTSHVQSLVAAKEKDYEQAYYYLQINRDQLNKEVQERLRQSSVKAQRDYYLLQKESLQKENRLRNWIIALLLLLIAVATMAISAIIKRYKERTRRQNQTLMEAVQDLLEKNEDLRQEYIHLGQENFKALSDLCNTYYKNEGRASQANVVCGEVRGLLKKMGLGSDQYPVLEQRVNEQFDQIMKHFRAEHPNHREPFYRTTCYLFAGFKTRTIALLLELEEQEIYRLKWRIKKAVEQAKTSHQKDFLTLLTGPS